MTPYPPGGPIPVARRLEGKTAVVFGAGQTSGETIGNGRATAILFARHGARVACVDRDLSRASQTAKMIGDEGGAAEALACDVTREVDVKASVEATLSLYGGIDILHNNVGGGVGDGPAETLAEDRFDAIMAQNLKGMWLTIKHVLPGMRARGGGAVVNISSLASLASAGVLAYELSKAGVNKLTRTVAIDNAKHGVRCNAILPGLLDTPMAIRGWSSLTGEAQADLRAKRNARVPLGSMGSAWDTANAALFLASDEARFITGVLLSVDGGQAARVG